MQHPCLLAGVGHVLIALKFCFGIFLSAVFGWWVSQDDGCWWTFPTLIWLQIPPCGPHPHTPFVNDAYKCEFGIIIASTTAVCAAVVSSGDTGWYKTFLHNVDSWLKMPHHFVRQPLDTNSAYLEKIPCLRPDGIYIKWVPCACT